NGGARAYIVNTGQEDVIAGGGKGLDVLERIDDVSLIAAPGKTDAKSYDALLTSAETTGDRFAILDSPLRVADINRLTQVARVTDAPAADGEGKGGLRARQSDQGCGAQFAFGIVA